MKSNCNLCVYGDNCVNINRADNPDDCLQFKRDGRMTDHIEEDLMVLGLYPCPVCRKDAVMGTSTNLCPKCWMRKIKREQSESALVEKEFTP